MTNQNIHNIYSDHVICIYSCNASIFDISYGYVLTTSFPACFCWNWLALNSAGSSQPNVLNHYNCVTTKLPILLADNTKRLEIRLGIG